MRNAADGQHRYTSTELTFKFPPKPNHKPSRARPEAEARSSAARRQNSNSEDAKKEPKPIQANARKVVRKS